MWNSPWSSDPIGSGFSSGSGGVGPTAASGTGACASAVAAARYGGAARSVAVVSPGGSQRVEWTDAGIHLTGWAELVLRGEW